MKYKDHTTALARFLGLALVMMATSAWAQKPDRGHHGRPSPEKLIEHFDGDGDGFLSGEEVPRHLVEIFGSLDGDGDGRLSAAELAEAPHPPRGDRVNRERLETLFQRFDEDGDGSIPVAELPEKVARRLAAADGDGDGALSREELHEFLSRRPPRGDHGGRHGFMETGDPAALFGQKDVNGDGVLSGEEISERLARRLDRVDLNGDGAVSLEEWQQMFENMRRQTAEKGPLGGLLRLLVGEDADPEKAFALLDENDDGSLSKDELPEPIQARFESLDGDGNGLIDPREWGESVAELRERMDRGMARPGHGHHGAAAYFEFLDENGDGLLQPEEIPEARAERLRARDTDGDGLLSMDEFASGGEHHRHHRGEQGPPSTEAIFAQLDVNEDGVITADEVPERVRDRLLAADADGDGAVTPQELQAVRDARPRTGNRGGRRAL